MPPPVLADATALCGEHITAAGTTDLATSNGQKAYLMGELGLSRAEAARLIKAYRADLERPVVTASASYSFGFLDWLIRQAPGPGRQRSVLKHQWRVTSA